MKKVLSVTKKVVLLVVAVVLMCTMLSSCVTSLLLGGLLASSSSSSASGASDLEVFYNTVSESQGLLDVVADDIYSCWYDAIYDDAYGGDIDTAIAAALIDNASEIERIEELDGEINTAFQKVKNSDQSELVKDIMSAYSDYYELVINVSGSFKTYSEEKETVKKELASLLRELSYEI